MKHFILLTIFFLSMNSISADINTFTAQYMEEGWICDGKPSVYKNDMMYYDKDKTPATGICTNEDKDASASMNVLNGMKEGATVFMNNKRQIMLETNYKNNLFEGFTRAYYPNGNIYMEGFAKNGKLEGILKMYHPNGKTLAELPNITGRTEGLLKEYFNDGTLGLEEEHKNNKRNGKSIWYLNNSEKAIEVTYKDDIFKSGYCIDKNKIQKPLKEEADLNRAAQICEIPEGTYFIPDFLRHYAGKPQPINSLLYKKNN